MGDRQQSAYASQQDHKDKAQHPQVSPLRTGWIVESSGGYEVVRQSKGLGNKADASLREDVTGYRVVSEEKAVHGFPK